MFEARPLTVRIEDDGSIVCIDRPLVALISARACFRLQALNPRLTPESLRYRFVRRLPGRPEAVYTRSALAWGLLRGIEVWRSGYWMLVRWLYDHGAFHFATEEGAEFRWRDIRLGS